MSESGKRWPPSLDELERLSQATAPGAAQSEAERAALAADPTLQRALAAFERLDAEAAALPDGLSDAAADVLVNGAFAAVETRSARPWLGPAWLAAGLAAGFAAAAATHSLWPAPQQSTVIAAAGDVWLGEQPLPLFQPTQRGAGELEVRTGADGAAVVSRPHESLWLPRNSQLRSDTLVEGALLAQGSGVTIVAADRTVTVDGRAFMTMEPGGGEFRVTEAEDHTMKNTWTKWGPAAAHSVAIGAFTLFVLDGHALVSSAHAAPANVSQGQRWSTEQGQQTGTVAPARPAIVTASAVEPEDLKAMTREQLLARVEALQNDKEALLREQALLKKRLADANGDGPRVRNYFHLSQDELQASAAKGELRLRVRFGEEVSKVDDRTAAAVHLTPSERKAIDALYTASKSRLVDGLRKLYLEIGGSQQTAYELGDESLLREIRQQSLEGEFPDAIRQLANERAGRVPALSASTGSAVLRAFRLVLIEDDRFVTDVEALLGSARAEAFLNDANTSHADNTWGVGAPKKKQ